MIVAGFIGGSTVRALVDIDIEKTQESFHYYAVPADFEAREGDEVLLHGVPTDIAFGTQMVMQCEATLKRANAFERFWTRFTSIFEITELYEVGFQPKDDIENGFIPRGTR